MYKSLILLLLVANGCASMNRAQEIEFEEWEKSGAVIEDKNPALGAALGVLPGCGNFYTGNVGYGLASVLLYPLSIAWEIPAGYHGSRLRNWESTRYHLSRQVAGH